MKKKLIYLGILIGSIIITAILAFIIARITAGATAPTAKSAPAAEVKEDIIWTCSMHPQIKLIDKVPCPICGMELIPLKMGENLGEREIRLSDYAVKLAEIQVRPVEKREIYMDVNLLGKINFDETRVKVVSARFGGRLDRLFVDYTGVPVKKGDHLFKIYSPELITAQEELLQAIDSAKEMQKSDIDVVRESSEQAIQASRDKLRLWGLKPDQITAIEKNGEIFEHIIKYSPLNGIVTTKHLKEGAYVKEGTAVYTISNLDHLWLELDAYERDLPWLHFAQKVSFETEAYPGEIFKGKISFIDPLLNPKTRTVKIRLNIDNKEGRLKPDMFVRARVKVKIGQNGQMVDSSLAGKWVSPMHPEVVSDKPGDCTVCGMKLVRAEELGFTKIGSREIPLVVPASAVMLTGKRAIVYVKSPDKPGIYEGRVVIVGSRAGDDYIVKEGLAEGELVVVNGSFKIDSSLQILAKPSMMSPMDEMEVFDMPLKFRKSLSAFYMAYLDIAKDLTQDKFSNLKNQRSHMEQAFKKIITDSLKLNGREAWDKSSHHTMLKLKHLSNSKTIKQARKLFKPFSESMIKIAHQFGSTDNLYKVECTMAFEGAGATWMQADKDVKNPYYGSSMLTCGTILDTYAAARPAKRLPFKGKNRLSMQKLLDAYLKAAKLFNKDRYPKQEIARMSSALSSLAMKNMSPELHDYWMPISMKLEKALKQLGANSDLEKARVPFSKVSALMNKALSVADFSNKKIYQLFCPMAFDNKGALWLQDIEKTANPYFGASMSSCGDVKTSFTASAPSLPNEEEIPLEKKEAPMEKKTEPKKHDHSKHSKIMKSPIPAPPKAVIADWVLDDYLKIHKALSLDKLPTATLVTSLHANLSKLSAERKSIDVKLLASLQHLHHKKIAQARVDFAKLSEFMIELAEAKRFTSTVRKAFCPMAFDDKGGAWLQVEKKVENPFYGSMMYRCGSIKKTFEGAKK